MRNKPDSHASRTRQHYYDQRLAKEQSKVREKMHHDEKGRISPAQSKVAQRLRGKSLGDIAESHGYPISHTRHRYGEKVAGLAGLHRMEQLKKANPHKVGKSKVILRGQKSDYRKAYTKGLTETTKRFKAKGMM